MKITQNTNPSFPIWIIIFLLIIIPINLSFKDLTNIDLDAYPRLLYAASGYLFTLPISFFFVIPFIFLGIFNFNKDIDIFVFIIICTISLISAIFNVSFSHIFLVVKIIIPIFLLFGFEIYFRKKLLFNKDQNIFLIIKNSNYKIALVFMIIFFSSMISSIYLENVYNWLTNDIVIYDYLQYFPMVFILLLGILASNNQRYIILLVYYLSFNFFYWGDNFTIFFLLILFGIYYSLSILAGRNKLVFLSKTFNFLIFFCLVFYQLFVIFYLEFTSYDLQFNNGTINRRIFLISQFYNNVNIFEFITPIRFTSEIVSKYYHNELTVIISAIGVLGAFMFYFILLKRIWYISQFYPEISVAISLVCALSGVVVTFNLHPYSFIISAFLISYYYVLSRIQSQKSL